MFEFPPEVILTVGGKSMVYIQQTPIQPQSNYQQHSQPIPQQLPTQEVLCKCNEPALLQRGVSEKTGEPWARYVCAKKPRDPKNCGFKKWIG